jgi:hypothetical protein
MSQAPHITFYGPRVQKHHIPNGTAWSPLSPESKARRSTGFDPTSRELHVGVFVRNSPNEWAVVGFDLFKTDLTLRAEALARLESKWREEAVSLPKRLRDKAHFARSFAEVPASRERTEQWKSELEAVLGDATSYEQEEESVTRNEEIANERSQPSSQ